MARQAAVSSESRRVIYSLWGGERAGDPEKANGAGRAGAPGAQGVVGECQHCGMREGKEGTHGSSRWQEDGEVPIGRCAGLTSPTFGGFEGLPLILLRSWVLHSPGAGSRQGCRVAVMPLLSPGTLLELGASTQAWSYSWSTDPIFPCPHIWVWGAEGTEGALRAQF